MEVAGSLQMLLLVYQRPTLHPIKLLTLKTSNVNVKAMLRNYPLTLEYGTDTWSLKVKAVPLQAWRGPS